MDININYYSVLGLEPEYDIFKSDRIKKLSDLDKKDFKKAYRDMSKKHHPDKGGDEERFSIIAKAYDILTKNKKEYDEQSKYGLNYIEVNELYDFEFSNNNTETEVYTNSMNKFKEKELLDILIIIDEFIEVIEYNKRSICNSCDGTGDDTDEEQFECDTCETTGEFMNKTCFSCKGKGYISPYKCNSCNGSKSIEKKVSILIPHSKYENGLCRIDLKGNYSHLEAGKVGNLYVKILSEYIEEEK